MDGMAHRRLLEAELIAAGVPITFRGKPWSASWREWVYFNCWLDRAAIRARLELPDCVRDHDHRGTHDGQEAGFVCVACNDGIMGVHESERMGVAVFR